MNSIELFNPAKPDQLVWSGNETRLEELADMTASAKRVQRRWSLLTGRQRHDQISAFLEAVEDKTEALAERMMLEQGKLKSEALGEVAKSLVEARWMLSRCMEGTGTIMSSARPGVRAMKIRRPRGVVLAITPWNFPVLTPMRKIAPALVFGNAILFKPSSEAPGAALLLQEAADETLPDGLVSLVLGGASVATEAIRSRHVDAVTFTGSTAVGRKIMAVAAEGLKEVSLELGGKNPAIVHDPADLDAAVEHIVRAAFANGGQRCTAISRVLVHEPLRQSFLNSIKPQLPRAGLGEKATLAPMSTRSQFDKVCRFVRSLDPVQTEVLAGGRPLDNSQDGYFFEPTLVEVKTADAAINFEELFGPVLGIEFYCDLDEAITRANAPEYGLTASVFASDLAVVRAFEDGIEAGMIHVNHGTFPDENMPFGGWKASGVGAPSVGQEADQFFTRMQAVYEAI